MITTIGIYSPCAGCGKSEVAKILKEEFGFAVLPFAGPLKRVAMSFLGELGYSWTEAERLIKEGKHERLEQLGVNVRHILRTLGSEWGRDCIHPDVWVKTWHSHPLVSLPQVRVVADDVRFPNEAAAIRARGGEIWRIDRPGHKDGEPEHQSEGGLGYDCDFSLINNATISHLKEQVCSRLQ